MYTFISLSGYKGLTKFIPRDCLNSTLIYIYYILFGYIPVHFIYWAEFELAMGQAVQYKYYIRQSGTVRQMNDPLLVKFICGFLYIYRVTATEKVKNVNFKRRLSPILTLLLNLFVLQRNGCSRFFSFRSSIDHFFIV